MSNFRTETNEESWNSLCEISINLYFFFFFFFFFYVRAYLGINSMKLKQMA